MNNHLSKTELVAHCKPSCTILRKNTFTLIELLVVISLIAIIASMLLPALSKTRARGRSIHCISNLKQLGFAYQMYADDFKGFYPAPYSDYYYSYYLSTYLGKPNTPYPVMARCAAWESKYRESPVISYTVSKVKRGAMQLDTSNIFYRPETYVRFASRMILLFDGIAKAGNKYAYALGSLDSSYDARHDGMAVNALFYDGSSQRAPKLSPWWLEYCSN